MLYAIHWSRSADADSTWTAAPLHGLPLRGLRRRRLLDVSFDRLGLQSAGGAVLAILVGDGLVPHHHRRRVLDLLALLALLGPLSLAAASRSPTPSSGQPRATPITAVGPGPLRPADAAALPEPRRLVERRPRGPRPADVAGRSRDCPAPGGRAVISNDNDGTPQRSPQPRNECWIDTDREGNGSVRITYFPTRIAKALVCIDGGSC